MDLPLSLLSIKRLSAHKFEYFVTRNCTLWFRNMEKEKQPPAKNPTFRLPKCRYQCRIHVSTWRFIIASCFRQNEQNLQIMSILKAVSESGRIPRKLGNKFEGIQSKCCWTLGKRYRGYPIVPIMLSESISNFLELF